jgi:hypothetical protein
MSDRVNGDGGAPVTPREFKQAITERLADRGDLVLVVDGEEARDQLVPKEPETERNDGGIEEPQHQVMVDERAGDFGLRTLSNRTANRGRTSGPRHIGEIVARTRPRFFAKCGYHGRGRHPQDFPLPQDVSAGFRCAVPVNLLAVQSPRTAVRLAARPGADLPRARQGQRRSRRERRGVGTLEERDHDLRDSAQGRSRQCPSPTRARGGPNAARFPALIAGHVRKQEFGKASPFFESASRDQTPRGFGSSASSNSSRSIRAIFVARSLTA